MHDSKPFALVNSVCSVVIENDGKYLLVQEKNPPAYRKWNFPGGRVDEGESLETAAKREALEETGYEVEIIKQLIVFHNSMNTPVLHAYSAKITGGSLQIQEDEILDARWYTHDEIKEMKSNLRDADYMFSALEQYEAKI